MSTEAGLDHCEFIATHKITGKKYSVEAKYRHRKNLISAKGSDKFKIDFDQLLHQALSKKTSYERIIFIDLDLPTSEMDKHNSNYFSQRIKRCEKNLIEGHDSPPAYIFLTNYPYHYDCEVAVNPCVLHKFTAIVSIIP